MGFDREAAISWYRRNRARSQALFDLLTDDAYYSQPIALRHPIVFYAGHLPAFSFNTLVKRGLGGASIDERLETLFARGIDPDTDTAPAADAGAGLKPCAAGARRSRRTSVLRQRLVPRTSGRAATRSPASPTKPTGACSTRSRTRTSTSPGHPLLDRAEAVFTILEHEAMHQETLLYMWHRLPFDQKRRPAGYMPMADRPPASRANG